MGSDNRGEEGGGVYEMVAEGVERGDGNKWSHGVGDGKVGMG